MTDPTAQPRVPRRATWSWVAIAALVAGVVLAGFAHTVHDCFLGDDYNVVYACSRVTAPHEALDFDGSFRLRLIREVYPDYDAPATLVRPLSGLSLWLDSLRAGNDPFAYRCTALALHAFAALLVAVLAHRLAGSLLAAAVAGALFAAHPAHAEAVVWIAARADLLVGLFLALALLAWLHYLDHGRWRALLLAAAAFALALGSKEMAAPLPALAFVLAGTRRGPGHWRRALVGTAVLGAVLVAYVLLRLWLVGSLRSYYHPAGGLLGAAANGAAFLGDAVLAAAWPGDRVAHRDPDPLRLVFAVSLLALAASALRRNGPGQYQRRQPLLVERGETQPLAAGPPGAQRRWRSSGAGVAACAVAFVLSTAPVAVWSRVLPDGQGTRLLYPTLMFAALALGVLIAPLRGTARWAALAAGAGLLVASLLLVRRATEPWQRAATTMCGIVRGLVDATAGTKALLLCNDLPLREGPAYLAQNALPSALWLWRPGIKVEFASRPEWEALVVEHRQTLERDPTLAALRFDGPTGRWVDARGR